MTELRVASVVFGLCAFGWALVATAESRIETPETKVVTRIHTVHVEPAPVVPVPTPLADALVDWDEHDRQTDCLWRLLQREQVEITFAVVMAAGVWTDALGGACRVIGDDDE